MADVFSKAKRSEVMSRIRSRGNKGTEVVLARLLRRHGVTGWRRYRQLKIKNVKLKNRTSPRPSPQGGEGGKFEIENLKFKKGKAAKSGARGATRPTGDGSNSRVAARLSIGAARQHRPTEFKVRPDFVFMKSRVAVFVDGCFWHGCPKHGTQPKGNRAFWRKKFAANRARDLRVRADGWRVVRIWEHALRPGALKRGKEIGLLRRIRDTNYTNWH